MSFDPYLMFKGNCRAAMTRYAEIFDGELFLMTYAEAPESPAMPKSNSDSIMHACVTAAGRMLLASDFPDGMDGTDQQGVSISHGCRSRAEAEAIYMTLLEGGTPITPFGDAFWCDGFGMLRDRFGTHWMIGGPSTM